MNTVRFFIPFTKQSADNGSLLVSGWASISGITDTQLDVIDPDALKRAIDDWQVWGSIREQHDPKRVVGTVHQPRLGKLGPGEKPGVWLRMHPSGNLGAFITARITDQATIAKIRDHLLNGFSIGGEVLDAKQTPEGRLLTDFRIAEVSLVDRPALNEAGFTSIQIAKRNNMGMVPRHPTNVDMARAIAPAMASRTRQIYKSSSDSIGDNPLRGDTDLANRFANVLRKYGDVAPASSGSGQPAGAYSGPDVPTPPRYNQSNPIPGRPANPMDVSPSVSPWGVPNEAMADLRRRAGLNSDGSPNGTAKSADARAIGVLAVKAAKPFIIKSPFGDGWPVSGYVSGTSAPHSRLRTDF